MGRQPVVDRRLAMETALSSVPGEFWEVIESSGLLDSSRRRRDLREVLVVEPGRVREPGRFGKVFGEHVRGIGVALDVHQRDDASRFKFLDEFDAASYVRKAFHSLPRSLPGDGWG